MTRSCTYTLTHTHTHKHSLTHVCIHAYALHRTKQTFSSHMAPHRRRRNKSIAVNGVFVAITPDFCSRTQMTNWRRARGIHTYWYAPAHTHDSGSVHGRFSTWAAMTIRKRIDNKRESTTNKNLPACVINYTNPSSERPFARCVGIALHAICSGDLRFTLIFCLIFFREI